MIDAAKLPTFDQLPVREGAPAGSAWGVFGDDDELGTWNLVTPEKAVEAAQLVRHGRSFRLDLPLDEPGRPLFWFRGSYRRTMFDCSGGIRVSYDEHIDNFCPQTSTQWDGHRHVCHPTDGFYNGFTHEQILEPGSTTLGIQNVAQRGVVTRGVLLDVGRFLEKQGKPLDLKGSQTIDVETLEACRQAQGVEVRPGDVLIYRTAWLPWVRSLPGPQLAQLAEHLQAPGILGGREMAAYLWDMHIAAIASDVVAVEAWPPTLPEPGFFHIQLITYLGMNLGEMWDLEALAADCAEDGVYEFMLTSAPLNLPGGIGSPANAIAVK
jgi:hypothetical protein